jgi:hypothetical protein
MENALIPIIVFVLVYIALTFELVNKAVAALAGVSVLVVSGIVNEHDAVQMIDFETIMLLLGMMVIVVILRRSGFFTLVSVKIAEFTKGSLVKVLIFFSIFIHNCRYRSVFCHHYPQSWPGGSFDTHDFCADGFFIRGLGAAGSLAGWLRVLMKLFPYIIFWMWALGFCLRVRDLISSGNRC